MTARYFTTLIALLLVLSIAMASARDPSVELCTRKDDFMAKRELVDPLVQKLAAAKEARKVRRVEWQWVVNGESSFNDYDAKAHEVPVAKGFCYPVSWCKDLQAIQVNPSQPPATEIDTSE